MERKHLKKRRFVAPAEPESPAGEGHNTQSALAAEFSDNWRGSVERIIAAGKVLLRAKDELKHGQWGDWVADYLPIGHSTANKLTAIAKHPIISKPEYLHKLPPNWGALYVLTTLPVPDEALEEMLRDDDGPITCEMTEPEAITLKKEIDDEGLYLFWQVPESLGVLLKFARQYPDPASIAEKVWSVIVGEPPRRYKHRIKLDGVGEVVRWLAALQPAVERAAQDVEDREQEKYDREELDELMEIKDEPGFSPYKQKRLLELLAKYPTEK